MGGGVGGNAPGTAVPYYIGGATPPFSTTTNWAP